MKGRFILSILPLVLIVACSIEDPDTGPPEPEPEVEAEVPVDQPDTEPPSVPVDLEIVESSYESLGLTWKPSTDNDEVSHYEVYMDAAKVSEVNSHFSTLTGLSPGVKYALFVVAVDASGNSSQKSDPLEATTPTDQEPPSVPGTLSLTSSSETEATVSWEESSDNTGILEYDVYLNDALFATTSSLSITFEGLEGNSSYSVRVRARDQFGNNSSLSEPLEFKTESAPEPPPANSAGLLFFSEYIEGSSYNKALEIVNITGAEVDLSGYSIKKISNENEAWTDERPLEGSLAHAAVFVIAHSRAIPPILEEADLLIGGGIISFNGNDVVGLFRGGELIDVIGFTGGENFAKDVTLKRKSSVSQPNTTYTPEEWEVLEIDSIDGLGNY